MPRIGDFPNSVDLSGRHETPAGCAGQRETPQERSDEEAPGPPAESEVPGAQINRQISKPLSKKYHFWLEDTKEEYKRLCSFYDRINAIEFYGERG